MSVKLKLDVKRMASKLDRVGLALEVLKRRKSYVKAGVMQSKKSRKNDDVDNVKLAIWHNYGTSNSPARPFVLPPFLANKPKYLKVLEAAFRQHLMKGQVIDFDRALGLIGMSMQADIRNYVTQGDNLTPNAPSTVKLKGSSRPLVDTGALLQSLSYEVVK